MVMFALTNHPVFADKINLAKQCTEETAKETFNKTLLQKVCLQAAQEAEAKKKL